MPPIQLVVCDMAGTTVQDNHDVEDCFLRAADATGLTADPEQVVAMMGWPKKRVFETLWAQQLGQDHPDYGDRVHQSFEKFRTILEDHYRTQPVDPTVGCLELLAWLKAKGIPVALTTGFYREVTNIILHRLGWDVGLNGDYIGSNQSIIQASITPSEIFQNEGRPAPFMIQKAMYRLGITDPQTVVNIGDTPSDLASGFHAHCRFSFGVTNGTHRPDQLAAYPNSGLFSSLADFQATLAAL